MRDTSEQTGSDGSEIEPLILCPNCKTEMRLFGIEAGSEVRDLYTFECHNCGRLEVRSVLVALPYSPKSD